MRISPPEVLVRSTRLVVPAFLVGTLVVSAAWAGVGLSPMGTEPAPVDADRLSAADVVAALEPGTPAAGGGGLAFDEELSPEEIPPVVGATTRPAAGRTPDGTFLVGAARASLAPAPDVFGEPGDHWETEQCTAIEDGDVHADHVVPSLADLRGWPAASPDCVYLGGFDIGPTRPARRVGHGGVWVRALAISNGEQTFVYAIADTVGWFARYDSSICADCGVLDVRHRLSAELEIDPAAVVVGSTHTHAGADTYGGWGGVPDWYRAQLRDATVAAVKQAVVNARPATVRVGETNLRHRNEERRDTYFSNADTGATWLQAVALPVQAGDPRPVIATMTTFAGHPTVVDETILHADWPGAAARRLEALHGGVGLVFEGGLGNVSISQADDSLPVPDGLSEDEAVAERTGVAFADEVSVALADGATLDRSDMAMSVHDITHPATTNPGLTTLATVGLFDREFTPGTQGAGLPGTYSWSKQGEVSTSGEDVDPSGPGVARSCVSTGPTVITTAGMHRLGSLAIAFAPGEIFSNIAEVVKEEADASATTMVLGQTNDALGYIIQSFELDVHGNAVTEYGTQTGEYEEVFAIDRCFGDHVLQTLLEAASALDL